MHMLAEDIEAGRRRPAHPPVRPPRCSRSARNLALTPGKVIFQNELMQLIQYAPTTETVLKRPLLIVPPWINKFYILDLTPEKSFIKWCVDQGLTVFVISWVNPDEHARQEELRGLHARGSARRARRRSRRRPARRKVNAIGYCVGGTLLAVDARLHGGKRRRRASRRRRSSPPRSISPMPATSRSSSTRSRSAALERADGASAAISKASKMATAFNLLRSNDLIWPYVINNYLKGKAPLPVRPALLEFGCDAHAGREPLVLSAQLLPGEPARARARWRSAARSSISAR